MWRGEDSDEAVAASIDLAELLIVLRQYHTGKER